MATVGDSGSGGGSQAQFPSQTHWTTIIAAGGPSSSTEAREALNRLCQAYWFPLYAFIRRWGYDRDAAKDLTQSFFVHLLQRDLVAKADRQKGRFRNFLCACLTNFLINVKHSQKPDLVFISIDEMEAEDKYNQLPTHEPTPTQVFDRTWAAAVIDQASERLKQAYACRGKRDVYEALKGYLTGELSPETYPQVAAKLRMTKETLAVNVSRFKDAFGKAVHGAVAQTIAAPAEIDEEIKYLMAAWVGNLEQPPEVSEP